MNYEVIITGMLLLLCWAVLAAADAAVAGVAAISGGVRFRTVFLWGLLSLLVPVAAIAYGTLVERNRYQVKEMTIDSPSLPEPFDGFTIAHVSDIHLRSFANRPESLRKAVEKINAINPDIVCFTGDLVSMDVSEMEGFEDILKAIKAPVYSVLGNHDYHIYAGNKDELDEAVIDAKVEELKERERALGWNLLLNGNRIVRRGADSLAVIGVENTSASDRFPSHGDLQTAMEGTDGSFRVLLSHDPTHWEMEVIGKDIPLMLSGHTHAMQCSLLGWCPSRYLFTQYRGLYSEGSQSLYVNIGLGETIFPARIGARPEITMIRLNRTKNGTVKSGTN